MAENNNIPTRALYCEQCRTAIGPEMDQCPRCGGTNFTGYDIENPYSTLPMQRLLKVCGHIVWLLGVVCALALFWQTNHKEQAVNYLFLFGGLASLFGSLVASVCMFALGELLRRVIRVQRKLRAFVEEYAGAEM